MKIAICDDDIIELDKIKKLLTAFISAKQSDFDITLEVFNGGPELLYYIDHISSFDLILLDIIMPAINGIDVAAQVRKTNNDCKIIFLTSSPEFAVNSYKVNAFYYLLKPYENQELLTLLDRAMMTMLDEQLKSVIIKGKTGLNRVPLQMIEYIESIKHTLNFHLRGNETLQCNAKMDEFREYLLADVRFIQCHQSFIVNMSRIAQITNKNFVLQDKTLIPISRTVYSQVKQAYIHHFFHEVKN